MIRGAYELRALASSDEALGVYAARGLALWRGTASVLAAGGIERTEQDEDCIFVLPVSVTLGGHGEPACDWRRGDVW